MSKHPGNAWNGNPGPPAANSYRDYMPRILEKPRIEFGMLEHEPYTQEEVDEINASHDEAIRREQEQIGVSVPPPESKYEQLCFDAYFVLRNVTPRTQDVATMLDELREAVIFR